MENKVISTEYVKKNFIHKDKIRKIIEKLKYYRDNTSVAKHYVAWYSRKIDTLEELLADKLLEETKDENNLECSTKNKKEQ